MIDTGWQYEAIVTNLEWEPIDLCRFYNQRCCLYRPNRDKRFQGQRIMKKSNKITWEITVPIEWGSDYPHVDSQSQLHWNPIHLLTG
nr:hypothetical protein [Paenibacillus terrigena]